ncbi:MAG: hypothetical protein JETT_2076 [Candidatus Jettenia ecosi]|uniref:Uncharacterized protein n=1 Tax=Candidatus Jettenia ecosi TaxID=2494326 RepID=A0A533QM37_9BACT|nr:MAG: hypothetical protein JETT_2076 [Candidatus Jettenia ecosi]
MPKSCKQAKVLLQDQTEKVEFPEDLRIENNFKEFYLFDGEYTTKRDKKATENQDRGKGVNDKGKNHQLSVTAKMKIVYC